MAYMVGLLTADGCLIDDGRHIDFTSKDLQLATLYKSLNFPTNNVTTKCSGRGDSYYRVEVSDVTLYDFLLSVGLTPKKSHTIRAVSVPDNFFSDFLRGYFDGDGSIGGYFDLRWKNSFMYYTQYTSASIQFIQWLRTKIHIQTAAGLGSVRTGKAAYNLCYAKASSRILFKFMYTHAEVPKLERKYNKYLELFAADPYN